MRPAETRNVEAETPGVFAEQEGLDVARDYARWHIGDPTWADLIIDAYLNPGTARQKLAAARNTRLGCMHCGV